MVQPMLWINPENTVLSERGPETKGALWYGSIISNLPRIGKFIETAD